jgi:aminoglycoside 6-adenylyltransferase
MSEADRILSNILSWAEREESIRVLILEGSRALSTPFDELADFDISVFTKSQESYTQDDLWLTAIGEVWVGVSDKYDWGSDTIPTRLIIFKDGVKVDFSFIDVHKLTELNAIDYHYYSYKVLLDKDRVSKQWPTQIERDSESNQPTEKDYMLVVKEFWFEAYHVAKYLKRGELWLVKFRDWETKQFLLKMIEWHAKSKQQWSYETQYMGKHMMNWADKSVWQELHHTFAHFDRDSSWECLIATMNLFRQIANEVAENLNCIYPAEIDRNITGFILKIRE